MLSKEEARKLVETKLTESSRRGDHESVIMDEFTREEDFGWVFFYDSKEFVETGDDENRLLGNAPYLVNKRDGSIHGTGTAYPTEYYIENYRRTDDTYRR